MRLARSGSICLRGSLLSLVLVLLPSPSDGANEGLCIIAEWPDADGPGVSPCTGQQIRYGYFPSFFDCDGVAPFCAPNGFSPEAAQFFAENKPDIGAGENCDNPWSAVYVDCNPDPTPADCPDTAKRPLNDRSSCIGDPVDLTTGTLEQTATDLDFGGGLTFTRHYASTGPSASAMGLRWKHSLDWSLRHQVTGTDPLVEVVMVMRPLATSTAFHRVTLPPPAQADASWKGGAHGAGGLSGEDGTELVYTDDDGTHVTFHRTGSGDTDFEVTKIQRRGEPAIVVSRDGATTTYAASGAAIAITMTLGRVSSITGSGTTWGYSYDAPTGCLLTASGPGSATPEPGNPPASVLFTYTYELNLQGGCSGKLKRVDRRIGDGPTVAIAQWTYSSINGQTERIAGADEPALDQKLCLGYSNATITSVCEAPAAGDCGTTAQTRCGAAGTSPAPLATYTSDDGRVESTTGQGGPGVEVAFEAATFTAATSTGAPANLWSTTRDLNAVTTLYEEHDTRGRPKRIVEEWVDAETDPEDPGYGKYSALDDSIRLRTYAYHPHLDDTTEVSETSVLDTAVTHSKIRDYDTDGDVAYNNNPTDLLRRTIEIGLTLDAAGLDTAFSDVTQYSYDGDGRLTEIKGPFPGPTAPSPYTGPLTQIGYDPESGSRSFVRRCLDETCSTSLQWTFASFDAQGNPQTVTDPNDRATAFTYDTLGRVLTAKPPCEVEPCTGAADTTISFRYDVDGNLVRVQFPDDSAGDPVVLDFDYDPAKPSQLRFIKESEGLVDAEGDPISPGNAIVYEYEKGRVVREERRTAFVDLTNDGALAGEATFDYDTAGRLIAAFNPLFPAGNVYSAFAHDPKGNVTAISDENASHAAGAIDPLRKDTLDYDALDRLLSIAQVRGATTTTTAFAYDSLSNVTGVTDAATRTTVLRHDDRGNLVETVSPDTGTTRFLYDSRGNLGTKIEAAGTPSARTTSYEYDSLDRLTKINLPTNPDWTFTYDTSDVLNQKGRLARVTNGTVTTELEYTRRGEVAVERTIVDNVAFEVRYEYDAAGNRMVLEAPSGSRVETSYKGLRPDALTIVSASRTEVIDEIAWYPFGPRTLAKLPPNDDNGNQTVTSSRTVNLRGQITEIKIARPGIAAPDPPDDPPDPPEPATVTLLHRAYGYAHRAGGNEPNDPGPNLDHVESSIWIDPRFAAPFTVSTSRLYLYDPLDRLAKETDAAGTVLHEYAYDPVGNRTTKTVGAGSPSAYAYEAQSNRLDSVSAPEARDYAHDAYGNRIYDRATPYFGTPSLIYDDANRLAEVRGPDDLSHLQARYTYDAFGRRVKLETWNTHKIQYFFYDTDGHLIEDVVPGTYDQARFYVFLEDELIALVDKQKQVGTPVALAPLAGTLEIDPRLLLGALFLLAGIGAGLWTRRWPVGIATTGSGAALLLLCAGTPPPPRFTFVHTDPLGTPQMVTNATRDAESNFKAAKVIWYADYEPFGKATVHEDPDQDTGTFSLAVRFPGQFEDAKTGYHSNMFRTYDPATGRYLETDPLGAGEIVNREVEYRRSLIDPMLRVPRPSGSVRGNPYAYALGDPLNLIDRDGGDPETAFPAADLPQPRPEAFTCSLAAADPAGLRECLKACAGGTATMWKFCRSLPGPPSVKTLCWAAAMGGTAVCNGYCYARYVE